MKGRETRTVEVKQVAEVREEKGSVRGRGEVREENTGSAKEK